jgi:hypothetical protein
VKGGCPGRRRTCGRELGGDGEDRCRSLGGGASSGKLALAVATAPRLGLGVLGGLIADGYRGGGEGGPVVVGGQKSSGKKNRRGRRITGGGSIQERGRALPLSGTPLIYR